jgi:hypothetical protein
VAREGPLLEGTEEIVIGEVDPVRNRAGKAYNREGKTAFRKRCGK